MENHHFSWENPLFLWQFSIAMLVHQRVTIGSLFKPRDGGSFSCVPEITGVGVPTGVLRKTHPQRHPGDFVAAKSGSIQQFLLNSSNHQKRLKSTIPIHSQYIDLYSGCSCCFHLFAFSMGLAALSCYLSLGPSPASRASRHPGTWALKKGRKDDDSKALHIFLGDSGHPEQ